MGLNKKLFLFLLLGLFLVSFASADLTDGVKGYYNLNETSGTIAIDSLNLHNGTTVGATVNQVGKIGTAYSFDGAGDYVHFTSFAPTLSNDNFTVSLWIKPGVNAPTSYIFNELASANCKWTGLYVNSTHISSEMSNGCGTVKTATSTTAYTVGNWYYITLVNVAGGNQKLYINGVNEKNETTVALDRASMTNTNIGAVGLNGSNYFNGTIDEFGFWNRSLTDTEVTELYNSGTGLSYPFTGAAKPTVTLESPVNGTTISDVGTNFTVSGNNISTLGNWTNVTYYVYTSNGTLHNSTTVDFSNNDTFNETLFIDEFVLGTYYWNASACYTNITGSYCVNSTETRTIIVNPFSVTSVGYELSVLETDYKNFNLTISTNPQVNSLVAYFWYDGVRYTQPLTNGVSGVYSASKSIDIPLQESSGNKSFLWQFIITLEDDSLFLQNTTTYSHQVNRTIFVNCNATYQTQFINFTAYSATNPFPIANNVTFKTAWNYYVSTGHGSVMRNYTYEDVTATKNTWAFCGSPNVTYQADAEIEYDGVGSALNFYYLDNSSLSNSTQFIKLYLLNDSLATTTVLRVRDGSQVPQEGYQINIQFYDVGTGTFYLVGMAKTDYKGEDVAYLNWYDTLYKFIVLDTEGNVVKTTGTTKITATPTSLDLDRDITFPYDKFKNFIYSLYFDNSTNNFVLTYTKPSGEVDEACLRVYRQDPKNQSLICNTCETSASATVFCNIGSYGNGTYVGVFYATGSYSLVDWIFAYVGGSFQQDIYNLLGNEDASFYAFLFAGLITVALFINAVFGIIALMIGLIGASALGFTALQWGEMMGVIIFGGFIIWLLKR